MSHHTGFQAANEPYAKNFGDKANIASGIGSGLVIGRPFIYEL
jgi:hypothetical protein